VALALIVAAGSAAAITGCREIINYESPPPPGSGQGIIWERTKGMPGEAVLSLRTDRDGNLFAGTESGRLFRTITDGDDWVRIPLPVEEGGITAILLDPTRRMFIANDIHGIFESVDNGQSWFQLNGGLGDTAVYCLAYLPSGRLVAGTGGGEIWMTGDSVPLWEKRTDLARSVTSILVRSNEEIYASTWGGGVYRFGETSQTVAPENTGLPDLFVNSLYSGWFGYIFAGTRSSGLFRGEPGQVFWQSIGGSSVSRDVIVFRATQYGELFAGTGTGIFLSLDSGVQWIKLESGIGSQEVRALAVNDAATVFAGTVDGVYRTIRLE